jgi:predicted negative regulator of RcsB-dependent stress response
MRTAIAALLVFVTFGFLGVAGYVGWQYISEVGPDAQRIEEASQRVEAAVAPEVLPDVRRVVADTHETLNQEIAFGRLEGLDYDEFEETVVEPVIALLEDVLADVDDAALTRDLETVIELLRIGTARQDPEALQFAHRVLHDLDYFAFNPESNGTYWGATVTLEGEDNPAQQYLADD